MGDCSIRDTAIERYDCEVEKDITNMVDKDRKKQNAACNKRIQEALRRSEEGRDSAGTGSENGLLSRVWKCLSDLSACPTDDPVVFFGGLALLVGGYFATTHFAARVAAGGFAGLGVGYDARPPADLPGMGQPPLGGRGGLPGAGQLLGGGCQVVHNHYFHIPPPSPAELALMRLLVRQASEGGDQRGVAEQERASVAARAQTESLARATRALETIAAQRRAEEERSLRIAAALEAMSARLARREPQVVAVNTRPFLHLSPRTRLGSRLGSSALPANEGDGSRAPNILFADYQRRRQATSLRDRVPPHEANPSDPNVRVPNNNIPLTGRLASMYYPGTRGNQPAGNAHRSASLVLTRMHSGSSTSTTRPASVAPDERERDVYDDHNSHTQCSPLTCRHASESWPMHKQNRKNGGFPPPDPKKKDAPKDIMESI